MKKSESSERRLKNYFFHDCWDTIPEPLRDELKSVDRLWFSQEKINLGGILESLKIITEGLVSKILWEPFIEWTTSTKKVTYPDKLVKELLGKNYDNYKNRKYKPALVNFVAMLRHPAFRESNNDGPELSLQDGSKFDLEKLAESLKELNRKRGARAHSKTPQIWQRQDVAPLLKKFFGINCPGILPFLARMLKETGTGT